MITEHLIPKLQSRFRGQAIKIGATDRPAVVFAAAHPEVGALEIYDEGEEIIVAIGKFTHTHFANYARGLAARERAERISEDVVAFLDQVFSDRIEFFGSHLGAGGYRQRRKRPRGFISKFVFGAKTYVWSGPLPLDG